MTKKSIWMAVVNDNNTAVFAKAFPSRRKAQTAIVAYLREHEDSEGKGFDEACLWIGERNLLLDLMIFQMYPEDFREVWKCLPYFRADLPLKEKGLYRVIYEIDVGASSAIEAARTTYEMMSDSESMPPVLDVIDNKGNKIRIDLSQRKGKE
jgi:hypothetical protein